MNCLPEHGKVRWAPWLEPPFSFLQHEICLQLCLKIGDSQNGQFFPLALAPVENTSSTDPWPTRNWAVLRPPAKGLTFGGLNGICH